jgi:GT2 family glycosyltransferase
MNPVIVTASIVIYRSDMNIVERLCSSILSSCPDCLLFIVNNDPTKKYDLFYDKRIRYIQMNSNVGFGKAHNVAIRTACDLGSNFHFIINPDITIGPDVIPNLLNSMKSNPGIGLMMPGIINRNGTSQYLPKLIPSPLSLLIRKIHHFIPVFGKYVHRYEMRSLPSEGIYDIPIVSGCFCVVSRNALQKAGLFDERYFLYFEDWDLSRRVSAIYRTAINISVKVIHDYDSGANKSLKLFFCFMSSALKYFKKYGFFIDNNRRSINRKALSQF